MMRLRGLLLVLCACAVTTLCVTVSAYATDFGANDDTGKFAADGGAAFYERMAGLGLKQAIVTVRWRPSEPDVLAERQMLELTTNAAAAAGVKLVFAVYPYPPREIESGQATPEAFAAWVGGLARTFPTVRQFVVGNEPNQPAFFRPQFVNGAQASAARFGPYLASAYDALKRVDPGIVVVGVGLSPRGNDRPNAKSNISTSPVRFLSALGQWYRRSGRTTPLMDGFSFHPYPNKATDPLERGYPWPNAGFVNLDRIKQALWDAFRGTPQPTTVTGLKLYLDEVGWQVDTASLPGYNGAENVAVTDEATQAAVYADLIRRAQCDRDIAEVNVFGFYDDPFRPGFQAGLHLPDGTPRASADAVREAVGQGCASMLPAWEPVRGVVGATPPKVTRSGGTVTVVVRAREGAVARVCSLTGAAPTAMRSLLSRSSGSGCVAAPVSPLRPTTLTLDVPAGEVTVGVRLAASLATKRRTLTSVVLP